MLEPDLLARFTSHLKEVLQKALAFAIMQGRQIIEPGDLVVGLLQEKGSIGCEILAKSGMTATAAENAFRGQPLPQPPGSAIAPDLSLGVKRVLEKCVLTAHLYEHKYVGTEHLLEALIELPLPDVHAFFEQHGMNLALVKEQLSGVMKSTSKFPDLAAHAEDDVEEAEDGQAPGALPAGERPRLARDRRPRALEVFARDLTAPDLIAKLDPVIGREAETERLVEILCRRVKNNPILLGDPGVGKTAIVEGLAQRLAAGDVPDALQGKRILVVDLALMVAGTMYRGEFEARLKQLVDEVRNDPNIILFIDEIHNIVGAGSTSGSLDAANILKPALARGEIHCIGATTWGEYKKHIEPDAALERRYQPVDVREPTAEETLKIIQGLKKRYEDHHGAWYDPEALVAAVRLAERYLSDRFFPDKAIDVLDEAAAHVVAKRRSQESVERLRALEVALTTTREAKEEAVAAGSLAQAAEAQADEARVLKEKKALEKQLKTAHDAERALVTPEHVAQVVARMSQAPLSLILSTERDQLAMLEERLGAAVVGQPEAVRAVSETVRKSRLGLSDPRRPRASFLFVGPSGVGKTETALLLAKELFGTQDALVKLDMSEFSEGHTVSKLLGSPAGYVGYREGNRFTDVVRKRPHSVLLFDEFEKAHPDVQHLLLQVLEDGRASDATGRAISFRNTYVILTSNVGAEFLNRTRLGFDEQGAAFGGFESLVKAQLAERFRPELLNRLDRVVVFRPLEHDALKEILRRELERVLRRLEAVQNLAARAGDDVLDWLASRPMPAEEGARAARQIVEREVTAVLSRALVDHPLKKTLTLKVSKNQLKVG